MPTTAPPMVLVVDDEPSVRAVLATLLRDEGYGVLEAASGDEALRKVESDQPAVVLLDVFLPGLNGYVVCQRIRERHSDNIGIIFISGARTETTDRSAGLLIGVRPQRARRARAAPCSGQRQRRRAR